MTPGRRNDAGVTLIEMLVVLALFAIVAGTVVLALPDTRRTSSTDAAATMFIAHLDRAVDLTLATGSGFGIAYADNALRFVQRDARGEWVPHSDPQLGEVKLSAQSARISINAQEVFAVSADLIPSRNAPLRVQFGTGTSGQNVVFDGVRARRQSEQ